MIEVSLGWIAEQVGGELCGQNCNINGISTDTRSLNTGDLFIALVGPNFNGHHFVDVAEQKRAGALLVSSPVDSQLPQIKVDDTLLALGKLGTAVKAKVAPKTVAITGSAGKTTVKEMVAAILSRCGKVLATQGNFNNDIGVPLTLLRLESDHEFAVLELGANHRGEIAYTTDLAKPDVASITNVAASHLEGFGSLFGVARAKGEIFKGLSEKGVAILNADSPFHDFWMGKIRDQKVLHFSSDIEHSDPHRDFYPQNAHLDAQGFASFTLRTPKGEVDIKLNVPGRHNIANALLAAALAMQVGASLEQVQEGLASMGAVSGRLNVKQLTNQVRLIDDTYNANVSSVNVAIDLLANYSGRRILILGDMGELGHKARYYHEQVGLYAKQQGIDNLFTLGVLSESASHVFANQGQHFSQIHDLVSHIVELLSFEHQPISILVKGSRSARMESVVQAVEASPVGKYERLRGLIAC